MNEAPVPQSFIEFLRSADFRFFQEREVGLDIYLSGPWALLPAALAVASVTVFAVALFHLIPRRKHSISLLIGIGVAALLIGTLGAYLNYSGLARNPKGPFADIITRGAGRQPEMASQKAALLSLPLILGAVTAVESLVWAIFLLFFGGREYEERVET